MSKYVTMKNVADRLGLSISSVSSALSNRYGRVGIREEVRKKIKETADEMGYCRNALVQSLVSGRTRLLAFIIKGGQWREFTSRNLLGFIQEAAARGYFVRVFMQDEHTPIQHVIRQTTEQRIEGLCSWGHNAEELDFIRRSCRKQAIPMALIDYTPDTKPGIFVKPDDYSGIHEAIELLHQQGHRRIGHFYYGWKADDERTAAFNKAVKKFGLIVRPEDNNYCGGNYHDKKEIICKILNRRRADLPSAFFCNTDYIAAIFLQEAYKIGLRVPEDISVIGYADLHFVQITMQYLTTVQQPFEEIGAVAARIMIQERESGKMKSLVKPIIKRLKTKLIRRASTARISR